MKAAINKEQSQEIQRWLEKQRVPKATIEILLSSQHAGATQKAYRMKKQISTPDNWGNVNFGANWARETTKPDKKEAPEIAAKPATKAPRKPATPENKEISSGDNTEGKDIKKFGEDFLSRTFMGLAEKLKRIQIEDVDKPVMQKNRIGSG